MLLQNLERQRGLAQTPEEALSLRYREGRLLQAPDLSRIHLRTPSGELVRLDNLVETAEAEGVGDAMASEIAALERAIERQKETMWRESREKIALELRREFVTRLQGYDAGLMEYFREDPQFQAALEVLSDRTQYTAILSGDRVGGGGR